jgi:hypothetical protein
LEPSSANDALEQRLALLQSLAASLEQTRRSVLQSDLEHLRYETGKQQEICTRLCQMPVPILPWPSLPAAEPALRLKEEIRLVEMEVAGLNLAYGALLRHARRTVDIFCRVLASAALTYTPPPPSTRGTCEVRS